MSVYFRLQSTRPVWGATCQTHSDFVEPGISIHAPVWGATVEAGRCKLELTFQSTRPAWGRDKAGLPPRTAPGQFQSTRPAWGRDDLFSKWLSLSRHFNPRAPHGGATYAPALLDAAGLISIHVPRVGRDRYHRFYNRGRQISIHAPAWGATCRVARDIMHFAISIHAPAWGATRTAEAATLAGTISIHAPAWGATKILISFISFTSHFNPRARVGRDTSQHRRYYGR